MKNGLLRNLRFDLYNFGVLMISLIPILIGFYYFYPLIGITLKAEYLARAFVLIPLVAIMQRSTVFYKNMVGFSITRKNNYWSGLVLKLIYAVAAVVACLVVDLFSTGMPVHEPGTILLIFLTTLFCGCLGDVLGLMMYKFDRIGIIIYFATSIFIGIVVAAAVLIGIMKKASFDSIITSLTSPYVYIALFVLSAALAFLSWLLVKKMPVKA